MPLPVKICLFNIGLAIFFSACFSIGNSNFFESFTFFVGAVCIVGGVADVLIALPFFIFRKDAWGYGFLLSGAVLLAGGFVASQLAF